MSKVSVIVPVYDVEDYIDACMQSLQRQSLGDIEIICVNDGSTDGSRERLSYWSERDARIRILDKPNGGLSSARNAGIDVATSPYVCFLDSDDAFHPDACLKIARTLDESGADVFTFGATWTPEDAAQPWLVWALSPRDAVYEGFDQALLFEEASRPFAWRTACRLSFLRENGIRFDEQLAFGEDTAFHFAVYPRAAKTVLSSERLYDYRVGRTGSLMGGAERDRIYKMYRHLDILNLIFSDWEQAGLIDLCPDQLVGFALDFVLYGSLRFPDSAYVPIARGLRDLFDRHWSADQIAHMAITSQARDIALKACFRTDMSQVGRTWLAFTYTLRQNGVQTVLNRLLGR